jgi:hypothetical protein
MKKILFVALLMITSIAAFSQQKPVLHNQFSDYVQFRKDHQRPEFNRHHRPEFGPQHFPMQPKPLSVTVKGDKVIVIFKKEDFQKLRPMVNQRIMWRERPRGRVQQMLIEKMEH